MLFPEPARVTVITVVGPTLAATAVTAPIMVIESPTAIGLPARVLGPALVDIWFPIL
jgi:hypothetical protein